MADYILSDTYWPQNYWPVTYPYWPTAYAPVMPGDNVPFTLYVKRSLGVTAFIERLRSFVVER